VFSNKSCKNLNLVPQKALIMLITPTTADGNMPDWIDVILLENNALQNIKYVLNTMII
jgi:uncharacterized membrane protein